MFIFHYDINFIQIILVLVLYQIYIKYINNFLHHISKLIHVFLNKKDISLNTFEKMDLSQTLPFLFFLFLLSLFLHIILKNDHFFFKDKFS